MSISIRILAGKLDRGAGSHVYHQELARRLAARGHKISIVCFEAVPGLESVADITEIPLPRYETSAGLWRFAHALQLRHCSRQIAGSSLAPADVVIAGEHLFLKGHAKKFPRTPWIYLAHSLVVDQEIKSYNLSPIAHRVSTWTYTSLQRWAMTNATRTLRFTHQACTALDERYGPSVRARYFVNPMGVELPDLGNRAIDANREVRFLWVGQLIARKRIDIAIDALARLPSRAWRFDVVGAGDCREALEAQVRRLGLEDRVAFHGFQSEPKRFYQAADLLLFPSWLENFPVTMMEAMSNGLPCLAMKGDGVRFHNANSEIVNDGVDGYLAESDDHFGQLLEKLVSQPEGLRAAGVAARAAVERQFTWNQHLDRYEREFSDLLGNVA